MKYFPIYIEKEDKVYLFFNEEENVCFDNNEKIGVCYELIEGKETILRHGFDNNVKQIHQEYKEMWNKIDIINDETLRYFEVPFKYILELNKCIHLKGKLKDLEDKILTEFN